MIIKELLRGDSDAFERARSLGFPRPFGQLVKGSRLETLWRERDIEQWVEQIRATAAALGR